ncbi:ArsR/SmtB family transcription factor [Streptomyces natalensis]|uniref:ArsR/SmtB family transcription factor n=1 Tax=Streptomyces natalensis TaxID=68242 RepID=UPI0007C4F135|nr:winged helix-turn-helix domain-containing protein [Streptomyces natalensis]
MAIRIHFAADDFARVRFARRPAPLQELNVALMKMCLPDDALLFGRWRRRLLRSLPPAVGALRDLVPGDTAPLFLDVFADTLQEGLDTVRATPPALVRAELARVHAPHPAPPPPWIRGLHRGDADAWHVLRRAQQAAFEAVLRPVWPLIQDLHHAEFTRHAVTTAEQGVAHALTSALPGSQLSCNTWELASPTDRTLTLQGRGLVLVPTFHWTGHPLIADPPGGPLHLTYPAGTGLPPTPPGPGGDPHNALSGVLGHTRADALHHLADPHTTTQLARRLRISNATASAHTAALRAAGLITTTRTGRSVLHRRTALGSLLVRRGGDDPQRADSLSVGGATLRGNGSKREQRE